MEYSFHMGRYSNCFGVLFKINMLPVETDVRNKMNELETRHHVGNLMIAGGVFTILSFLFGGTGETSSGGENKWYWAVIIVGFICFAIGFGIYLNTRFNRSLYETDNSD